LRWGLEQSLALVERFSTVRDMPPACKELRGDFLFLVVGSQIDKLTPDPSFGHNMCSLYPNGSCKLILDIYVSRAFQWYKEIFNLMSFDP
jgi:hypothetical protein